MTDKLEWLKPRIKKLVEIAEPFKVIQPDILYETGPWTIIKLLVLLRFVDIYTKIIKAPRQSAFFQNMYYIDLLAGSGLCRIKLKSRLKGDVIAGSALIACTQCYHPFDKYFFVEKNLEHAKALEMRVKTIAENFTLFNCDCNDCIENIMGEIGEKDHYLAFVDCEGLDVSWSTMQSLFAKSGDILLNFQTQNICRVQAKALKDSSGSKGCAKRLNWFFGDDRWEACKKPDDFLHSYISKIEKETNRKIVLPLPVKGPRGYRYDIILATRRTRGGSPWIKPMEELQKIMGGYRPAMIKIALDILMKRQLSLLDAYAEQSGRENLSPDS